VPPKVVVHTAVEQAAEDGKGVNEFLKYIRWMLLGFGGVSLFVGAFVIFARRASRLNVLQYE
jgi:hypothetical protein